MDGTASGCLRTDNPSGTNFWLSALHGKKPGVSRSAYGQPTRLSLIGTMASGKRCLISKDTLSYSSQSDEYDPIRAFGS